MMKKLIFASLIVLLVSSLSFAQSKVVDPKVENLVNPTGIDVAKPVFSWRLQSDKRNILQTAYEVKVAKDAAALATDKNLLWSSGKVNSDQSLYVAYGGLALESG